MSRPRPLDRAADDTAVGEAAGEYEEFVQDIAKRKRDGYIRHISEQQCVDPLDVPLIHHGGQSRPLFIPATWEPESSEEDEPDRTEHKQVSGNFKSYSFGP